MKEQPLLPLSLDSDEPVDLAAFLGLEIDEEDLHGMFEAPDDLGEAVTVVPGDEDAYADTGPSDELFAVSRRIAGQYVDLVEAFASAVFRGRPPRSAIEQFASALGNLRRLADATGDEEQGAVLQEMSKALDAWLGGGKRGRHRFQSHLRSWLPRFAEHLDGADADRMRNLVDFEPRSIPLFNVLSAIRGIGKQRLARLYCAGLHNVEIVCSADPDEIAAVTGLPRSLAAEVVAASRDYALHQRRTSAFALRSAALELQRALSALPDAMDPELVALALKTADDLRGLVASTQTEDFS